MPGPIELRASEAVAQRPDVQCSSRSWPTWLGGMQREIRFDIGILSGLGRYIAAATIYSIAALIACNDLARIRY